eukprot:TRINITY_DN8642_c0_g1_i2.p1 TRINITY_DN8642_c0_g1~~TRINITY_DN8642_c0_g1_i2.p1  ORF type:complete len:144 (+),score=15.90 TRINITY_DN8642_c0_g1_i2:282-713(+)
MPDEVAYESIDDLEAATDAGASHNLGSRRPDGEDPAEPQAAKTLSYQSLKELNAPLKFGDYPATEHETASDEQDLEDGELSDGSPRYLTGSYQHGETCEEEALYFEDYMPAGEHVCNGACVGHQPARLVIEMLTVRFVCVVAN